MKSISSTLLLLLISFSLNAQTLNVFVSTHPDDWQLFMNPNAFHSLDSLQDKTVFLHTTAGDAGAVLTNDYYLAREEGSLRGIRFMVNAHGNKEGYGKDMAKETSNINGHNILAYTYGNTRAYFMRLHDGFIVANDTMVEHTQSLRNFYTGKTNTVSAIDNSSTYQSIDDLKSTLKQLISNEAEGYAKIKIHVADTDSLRNPNDHPDHLHSSKIIQDFATDFPDVEVYLYEEYNTSNKPVNVFPWDLVHNAGTWGATASGLSDSGHYPTWDSGHNAWVGRQYFRVKE